MWEDSTVTSYFYNDNEGDISRSNYYQKLNEYNSNTYSNHDSHDSQNNKYNNSNSRNNTYNQQLSYTPSNFSNKEIQKSIQMWQENNTTDREYNYLNSIYLCCW